MFSEITTSWGSSSEVNTDYYCPAGLGLVRAAQASHSHYFTIPKPHLSIDFARAEGLKERFYSLSSQLEAERKDYYLQLEKQKRGSLEITDWLEWFLACLRRAIDGAESRVQNILFKSRLWNILNQIPVNERQQFIINLMLDDDFKGFMNTSKYAKLAKCSTDTALRDLQELKKRGILIQNSGKGRSTSYRLVENIRCRSVS
jgi:Fic family protein